MAFDAEEFMGRLTEAATSSLVDYIQKGYMLNRLRSEAVNVPKELVEEVCLAIDYKEIAQRLKPTINNLIAAEVMRAVRDEVSRTVRRHLSVPEVREQLKTAINGVISTLE
jgi:hypothetical protein